MLMMNTGYSQVGRPSIGSWLTYGLGTENKNLPGFVVLCPDVPTTVGPPLWNSSFLPAIHQGAFIADKVGRADGEDADREEVRSEEAGLLYPQRKIHARPSSGARSEPDGESRMQMERGERRGSAVRGGDPVHGDRLPDADRSAGGVRHPQGNRGDAAAVRAGQHGARLPDGGAAGGEEVCAWCRCITAKGDPWDAHGDIQSHRKNAKDSDRPFAAVIKDLKSRGLLKDTLVVCG